MSYLPLSVVRPRGLDIEVPMRWRVRQGGERTRTVDQVCPRWPRIAPGGC